jgi:NAD(P)-dependent dehydrogenase (short-subunit alcohol dehydrogenase family)
MSRRAIVTGAARGIGYACVERLAATGHRVCVIDRAGAAETARSVGADVFGVEADVGDVSIRDAIHEAVDRLGGLDVLVNNAGNMRIADAEDFPDEAFADVLAVHLGGVVRCSQAAFAALRDAQGAIVNTASISAHRGMPGLLAYAAAKSAIDSVTRTLAVEWAEHGIRVNAVAPGHIRTPMIDDAASSGEFDLEELRRWERRIPLGHRLGHSDEIAAVLCFLASPDASYVTGQVLVADGGLTINGTYD